MKFFNAFSQYISNLLQIKEYLIITDNYYYYIICIYILLTIYIALLPKGAWGSELRLGFEHDTLRLLSSPPHAGTQPIRITCTPIID